MRTWHMHSEINVKVFSSEPWKNVNEIAVSMETAYAKTKANKSVKNFVHITQFAIQRDDISSKSICLLHHKRKVFG